MKSVKVIYEDFFSNKLNDYQESVLNQAISILKLNTVGEVIKKGGNIKNSEPQYQNLLKSFEEKLDQEPYKKQKNDCKDFLKLYFKTLKQKIAKTAFATIPVKEMPFSDVNFINLPNISLKNDKPELFDNLIMYLGEIKCLLPRGIIYGKFESADPLFAPVMKDIEQISSNEQPSTENPESKQLEYIETIVEKLESPELKGFLINFHENFERRGNPSCDFLNQKNNLLEVMSKLTTSIDSHRKASDIAISAIAIPQPSKKMTLILVLNESPEENRFETCFEALLTFSASCCEASNYLGADSEQAVNGTESSQLSGDNKSVIRTPGGQEINVWTQEELAEEASKRNLNATPPDVEVWTEAELEELAKKRGTGIPEGMDVWDEESLKKLAEERQKGGLNIPKWEPDENMKVCAHCGYALRPSWKKCPICNHPVVDESK